MFMNRRFGTTLRMWAALFCCLSAVSAWADSQARIVRLSDVEGNLQIDRTTGDDYEKAFLNMPITEGVRLRTTEDARAEVEFEDGSTIHLVPNTIVEFTNLSLRDSGAKVSTIDVQQGQAYFNFTGKHDDEFRVTLAHESATLTRSAHFRVDVHKESASVAVFKGNVQVEGPAGAVEIASKHTATFDISHDGQFELAKNIPQSPFDSWDKQQTDYHLRYAAKSYNTPYSYGLSDLNYYGSYYDVPGYGLCWQPYFTSFGWDPFMDGAWMWYPGFGYSGSVPLWRLAVCPGVWLDVASRIQLGSVEPRTDGAEPTACVRPASPPPDTAWDSGSRPRANAVAGLPGSWSRHEAGNQGRQGRARDAAGRAESAQLESSV
ncbi:MAG: hypothetical protein DMG70_27385 [Acidobacteria bacterium]|nr:MAG: hypothetical protein DMG70_27385 [Acidobacteriota bacterium]